LHDRDAAPKKHFLELISGTDDRFAVDATLAEPIDEIEAELDRMHERVLAMREIVKRRKGRWRDGDQR
jgi:hypothetical protein